ncbi:GNAT family protein [Marivita sp.]|uniref:GNAT family N-acetyltransferase n=1 Tax=Marivita sp. TaxID=2003365 RepID=UPI0025B97F0D|nr:GNAT family protein [Marivita sp.]
MSDPLITGQRDNALGQPVGLPVTLDIPRPPPPDTEIEGRYCRLAPLARNHADDLFEAFAADVDGRGWTYLSVGPFTDRDIYRDWVDQAARSTDPKHHAILVDGTAVGHAGLMRVDPMAATLEVGWVNLSPALQRTRAATEFQFLLMARAFDELGYRRYEWKCDALNAPSRRAAARLGFTYEGTFRQATHYKGRNRDTAWFSILDSEWPGLKARFRRWLDPANFDAAGQQRTALTEI